MDVTLLDPSFKNNRSRIGKLASDLIKGEYTPEQVTALYSAGGIWYKRDWRGQRGETPTLDHIEKTIRMLMDPAYQDTQQARSNGKQTTFERNTQAMQERWQEKGISIDDIFND